MDFETIKKNHDLVDTIRSYGVTLRGGRRNRYYAQCPFRSYHTGKNKSNFSVFYDENTQAWGFYCFGCGHGGDVISFVRHMLDLPSNYEAALVLDQVFPTREVFKPEVIDPIVLNQPLNPKRALLYHKNLNDYPDAVQWWRDQGLTKATMRKYKVGYSPRHAVRQRDSEADTIVHVPTYTIPVYVQGELKTIRHRLAHAVNGDKYRPERSGDGAWLFNADMLHDPLANHDEVFIIAGEKKAMVIDQVINPEPLTSILPVVSATAGATNWYRDYGRQWAEQIPQTYKFICFDPNEQEQAERTAALFGRFGLIAEFPQNPDDYLIQHQYDMSAFFDVVYSAKPLRSRRYYV